MLTNKELGPFTVGEVIREGRYSTLYTVQGDERYVIQALTPILAQDIMYPSRFRQQMERATQLDHAHLLPLHNYGTDAGYSYVVTPRMETRRFDRMPDVDTALEIIQQVAAVLGYIHSQGWVHGDVCLDTIVFDDAGDAYLSGVGLAAFVQDTYKLIGIEDLITDPAYTAPEQWQRQSITPATDVYALGILAYRLLMGQVPFEASTQGAVQYQHLNETPLPIHNKRPELPPAVDAVIQKALAKQPHERYPSAPAFAKALSWTVQGEPDTVVSPPEIDDEQAEDKAPLPVYQRRPKTVGWFLRRVGCGALVVVWILLMLSPCVLVTVLAQGEFVVNLSDRAGHEIRLFEIQNDQSRGFGLSWGLLDKKDDDGYCLATHVRYWMWEGDADNSDYCQCYTPSGEADSSRQCEP